MHNQLARHQYRLWPRLGQLPVLVEPEVLPSLPVLDRFGPVQTVPPRAGLRQLLRSSMNPKPVEQQPYRS